VSAGPRLTTEDWGLAVTGFDPAWAAQLESLFAVSNGCLGWRGTLDEAPSSVGDTCRLSGLFDRFPLAYAEPSYGYPRVGQALVGAPDGALIRLRVDGEELTLGAGTVHRHTQRLDFRTGVLRRETDWESPGGARVAIVSERLVSLAERGIAAVRYEVSALDAPHDVELVSELAVTSSEQENEDGLQPIAALVPLSAAATGSGGRLCHVTAHSGIAVAAAVHHEVEGKAELRAQADGTGILTTITATLEPGRSLALLKLVSYASGESTGAGELVETAWAALERSRALGWGGLTRAQRDALDAFWDRADVELEGDAQLQQCVRFALFHVFQASALADEHPPPAKGLTGPGYQGHAFWDLDGFVVPVLALLHPAAAASALRWRHRTLPLAMQRAAELGLAGASFPWRTIDGRESSGYWPASTAAFHLNADIADAALRYVWATGDGDFAAREAVELLVQTARLWASLARVGDDGATHLDGVTGPDEYSALEDDNVYTNLMAQQNLLEAARAADDHGDQAARLGVTAEEADRWRRLARGMAIPFDPELQVHQQSAGYTQRARWDFEHMAADEYPLMQHHPYVQLYRHQVAKQADLVLALVRRPDAFTPAERARDFAYYEAITVRDSSLSAASQAVVAAEVGQLELAADYVREVAAMDLADLHQDTRNGIHLAAAAGLWTALAAGFGGLRLREGPPEFSPRLPAGIDRLCLRFTVRGRMLVLDIRPQHAVYRLRAGEPIELLHHGRALTVGDDAVTAAIPPLADPGPRPEQPRHRPAGLRTPR
jgi:alpha,alpha-trehalose phosphorylase